MGQSPLSVIGANKTSHWQTWSRHLIFGIGAYYLTSLVAILGVIAGHDLVKPAATYGANPADYISRFAAWDGRSYVQIADEGYRFNPEQRSNIAFFPAFPVAGSAVAELTACRTDLALLIVAHLALAAAFVVFSAYIEARLGAESSALPAFILLAFGLWPTTFFFRMTYSESLFLLSALLVLYALQRHWPLVVVAVLAGAATATRPVGVALVPVVLLAAWRTSPTFASIALRLCWILPLSCWGLAAYMTYQAIVFGDSIAFATTQSYWRLRPAVPLAEHALALVRLEPLWSVYDASSPCYWEKDRANLNALFNLRFANPLYFLVTVILVLVGVWRRWLTANELLLTSGLLLIPYITRSHEMCFCSMGRFAAVAFPVYMVMGQLLSRLPVGIAAGLLAVSGFFMGIYAALFAAGYPLF